MLRGILFVVGGVVALGLFIALMNAFGWDLGAFAEWVWAWITGIIGAVASFFEGNAWFRDVVSTTP